MRKFIFSYLFWFALLVALSCAGGLKFKDRNFYDWSGWKSFRKDAQNTAYLSSELESPKKLLWKYDAKKPLKSSPIVIGRMAIIGSLDKRIHFLDALSGKDLGTYKVSSSISTSACGENAIIYFGLDTGRETFFAIDLKSGQLLWKEDLGDLSSSPTIYENKIFVGSFSGDLWALDKNTGEKIWRFETKAPIFSTPAFSKLSSFGSDDKLLCFGSTNDYVYALNPVTGRAKWKFKADGAIYSSPAIKNGMVFFGSVDGNLYSLNLKDGTLMWSFKTKASVYSSPAVAESLVYIGSNDYFMYAVNQKTGKLCWKFETLGLIRSSPIAVGDKLLFGSYDGNFYVLNRFTGKLLWKYQTKGMISASPACHEGKIYLPSEDGWLYCFGP